MMLGGHEADETEKTNTRAGIETPYVLGYV